MNDWEIIEAYSSPHKSDDDVRRFYDRYLEDEEFRDKFNAFLAVKKVAPIALERMSTSSEPQSSGYKQPKIVNYLIKVAASLVLGGIIYTISTTQYPTGSTTQYPTGEDRSIVYTDTIYLKFDGSLLVLPQPAISTTFHPLEIHHAREKIFADHSIDRPVNALTNMSRLFFDSIGRDKMEYQFASPKELKNSAENKSTIPFSLTKIEIDQYIQQCQDSAKINGSERLWFAILEKVANEAFLDGDYQNAFLLYQTFLKNDGGNLVNELKSELAWKSFLCIIADWEHLGANASNTLDSLRQYDTEKEYDQLFQALLKQLIDLKSPYVDKEVIPAITTRN